jgi:transcriptional regulator with PAS, ATPase and Fis domain
MPKFPAHAGKFGSQLTAEIKSDEGSGSKIDRIRPDSSGAITSPREIPMMAPLQPSLPVNRDTTDRAGVGAANPLAIARPDVLVGTSPSMDVLRATISRYAPRHCNVLILGETGVGKDLIARELHRQSERDGPFVAINCATIAGEIGQSLLFGHARGAFSGGVRDHAGFFTLAENGTLFLDEIGEISTSIQAQLLRVVADGEYYPVGSEQIVRTKVRVIAATNRDLAKDIQQGGFRADLYYRFVAQIFVPPLRDRREDIPALVRHFLDQLRDEYSHSVELTEAAIEALSNYTWPGNARQLRSTLEVGLAMADNNSVIDASDLRLPEERVGVELLDRPTSLHIEDVEKWAIRHALAAAKGNQTQAARILGWHRDTLLAKIRRYGLERG